MCDFMGQDFGATYPDSVCIDGYLWDADSGNADPLKERGKMEREEILRVK